MMEIDRTRKNGVAVDMQDKIALAILVSVHLHHLLESVPCSVMTGVRCGRPWFVDFYQSFGGQRQIAVVRDDDNHFFKARRKFVDGLEAVRKPTKILFERLN